MGGTVQDMRTTTLAFKLTNLPFTDLARNHSWVEGWDAGAQVWGVGGGRVVCQAGTCGVGPSPEFSHKFGPNAFSCCSSGATTQSYMIHEYECLRPPGLPRLTSTRCGRVPDSFDSQGPARLATVRKQMNTTINPGFLGGWLHFTPAPSLRLES